VRLAGINAHHRDTQFTQTKADRRRHAARFDHCSLERTVSFEHRGQCLRSALDLFRNELLTIFVNDADLRGFHRQVQSGIMLHGCFLPSGFDNQKCAPLPRPEEAAAITQ
jgi:hypothetical protein